MGLYSTRLIAKFREKSMPKAGRDAFNCLNTNLRCFAIVEQEMNCEGAIPRGTSNSLKVGPDLPHESS